MNNRAYGKKGEALAAKLLQEKGFEILEKNYQIRGGEIDVIAKGLCDDEEILIFCEVKMRQNQEYGRACQAVTKSKQRKIMTTALNYIQKYRLDNIQLRFDIVEIYTKDKTIVHIENAFQWDS
ncbi:MAG: YraN family protein [Tissierellia bacterium]|nr:YraN family protein [Tissierellia bacterium]